MKGVCVRAGTVLLLRNEREEWELPGGKLELGEDPVDCVRREIAEETGWTVRVGPILDAWQYHIRDGIDVLVVTYGCIVGTDSPPVVSDEHNAVGMFDRNAITGLSMPDGYRRSVDRFFAIMDSERG